MNTYPKRLIEVDLPIKRISEHARREKSIRHGHISTLHIWWARRPLAACRAVICAALWPDPADPLCPQKFRDDAAKIITNFAKKAATEKKLSDTCSPENWAKWMTLAKPEKRIDPANESHLNVLRFALLDFIADFANWDNSTVTEYLETSRALTQSAHESLGGEPGTRPLVVDPFAGGGSIPLEALRVGADAFASDLNPVAVLLNKVVLEYIPKYGQNLADEVRKWGAWIKQEAEKELSEFYPKDPDGATPIAYLWARTIQCEGPGCGAEVPLMRTLWLAKKEKSNRFIALRIIPDQDAKRVEFEIIQKGADGWHSNANRKSAIKNPKFDGTVNRGSATCPCCGYTTPVASVRRQLKERKGGANDARLFCVATTRQGEQGRFYRLATERDFEAIRKAAKELEKRKKAHNGEWSLVPDEVVNPLPHSVNRLPMYGMNTWGDVFSSRQLLALTTLVKLVQKAGEKLTQQHENGLAIAVQTCLALLVDKMADKTSSLCRWKSSAEYMAGNTFGRQALPMMWDFCEANILGEATGDISSEVEWIAKILIHGSSSNLPLGHSELNSATAHPLPDDSAHSLVSDPPYFDMISYADLSDFFYVWLKRALGNQASALFKLTETPKKQEIIVEPSHVKGAGIKDSVFYLTNMTAALKEARRVVMPMGIGVIVFAHKSTSGWESLLQSITDAGWIITGSWPIDTEMAAKVAGIGQARLMSSIHLVCRPRENPDGSLRQDDIGDWRDVLQELPQRIHEWMPRLQSEGVVGADAIFACLGPALEIFSRYSRVEKASGEIVTLREYLEHVWAAVSREALNMIFSGADATGFEEDARLTAMWLWTLSTGSSGGGTDDNTEGDDDAETSGKPAKITGFVLEYDAARKIAQGLGAHLEDLRTIVEVKGDKARLLPAADRAEFLFGDKSATNAPAPKKKVKQVKLFIVEEEAEALERLSISKPGQIGETALDRVHQAMLLFAAGRGEAMKRFLVDDGVGRDQRFWRLAQALSALYPSHTDEKRWVDGVLARKKGLGL